MVHSEVDRGAPWLGQATRTVCIGPARAAASYLDAGAVLQAAEQTECQAVHPGYGFLAENALFAQRCGQQGLTFIGPGPRSIRLMGDKPEAKRAMASLGIQTIPGSDGTLRDIDEARELAAGIGYPVLLKARVGGGGKGMRLCRDEQELTAAFGPAGLEAGKSFGDPALYLERAIEAGRHIEFQILCDSFGAAVHLGERECSIQRKHQKLVEESPSPVVDDATRDEMGLRVARAVARLGYRNAGTVEFLRDADGRFYFMEMNTRLQVEHPVTEMVTGTDLVVEQLCIAANQPLRLRQDEVRVRGHAIEFRINAEDVDRNFRPDPGRILRFTPPPDNLDDVRVRWDSAIEAGYDVPPYYDSMVGKLIVHGPDRDSALRGAERALSKLRIEGVRTTIPFHQRLLASEDFRAGRFDTSFVARSGLLDVAGA